MTIGVCGASGRIGSRVLDLAREHGRAAVGILGPGVPAPAGDDALISWRTGAYEDRSGLARAFEGADAVMLVTPPDPRQVWWQRNIIDACLDAGVPRIVKVSAFAAREGSPTNMGRWHFDGELALAASGLDHVIVRPQYFMDNLLRSAAGVGRSGILRGFVPPDHSIAMIDVRDVAAVCFELLVDPEASGIVVPTGPEALTMRDVAGRIGSALGAQITYAFTEHGRARAELTSAGTRTWHVHDMLAITRDCGPEVTSDVEKITGSRGRTIEDFVARHRAVLV